MQNAKYEFHSHDNCTKQQQNALCSLTWIFTLNDFAVCIFENVL